MGYLLLSHYARPTHEIPDSPQRTQWAYIFGAICPQTGATAGMVMPYCDSHAMNAHLAEISRQIAPGRHAVLILDQAGWHTTKALDLPDNITLLPLPPRSPELMTASIYVCSQTS